MYLDSGAFEMRSSREFCVQTVLHRIRIALADEKFSRRRKIDVSTYKVHRIQEPKLLELLLC